MNKRTMFMIGVVSAALLTSAGAVNATPTKNTIYVDGTKVNGAAYMINNNNYFKLRDVAAMVNGSSKQFEVSWNETNKRIDLTTNKAYTVVGGEMALPSNAAKTAKESKASVFKDGNKADYTGYNISDNNYYKLRDLCKDMNIGVKFDLATNRVDILTTVGYGEENNAGNTTEPSAPTEPTAPTTPDNSSNSNNRDENYQTIVDYRQPGDKGLRSVDLGDGDTIHMYKFYPSYNHYSVQYQNLLDTCGEEIVTKTIYYYTYCGQTQEDGTLSGFPMEVDIMDDRIEHNTWHLAETIYVDSGEGSFELKMPKSVYEKILSGDKGVLTVRGTSIEYGGMKAVINGKTYQLHSNRVTASDVRDTKPTKMRFEIDYYGD